MIHLKLIFSCVFLTGLAGASGDAETELSVFEGRNLTIFTMSVKSEEDPQVMLSLLNGTSRNLIAQMSCHHNQTCEHEPSHPAVFIHYHQHNVTLGFVNANRSQTGRYEVTVHSKRSENRIYNITVIEDPLSTRIPEAQPSSTYSKQVSAGIGASVAVFIIIILIIAAVVMGVIYYRRGNFRLVRREDLET